MSGYDRERHPDPSFKVTEPTPKVEKKEFISDVGEDEKQEQFDEDDKLENYSGEADETGDGSFNNNTTKDEDFDTISSQPKPQNEMTLSPSARSANGSELMGRSSYTLSEAGSGYDADTNECSEFCLDCWSCFGVFDACCPSDSEGCITSTAVFLGNVCFSCCRCR